MLMQKFNLFNHVRGESLETQINRFSHLITQMKSSEITLSNAEVNKKLLNSLPINWNTNVTTIKKTKDMYKTTLSELISIINSYDLDDKQRAMNHANSMGISEGSNSSALLASLTPQQIVALTQNAQIPTSSAFSASTMPQSSQNTKMMEENIALFSGFMNSYNSFVAGQLAPPNLTQDELEQINPQDIEKLISLGRWQWQFLEQRTSSRNMGKTTLLIKEKRRSDLINQSSDASIVTNPDTLLENVKNQKGRERESETQKAAANSSNEKALVSLQDGSYNWTNQIQDLEEKFSHAYVAEVGSSSTSEVNVNLCSDQCIDKVERYRKHNEDLIKEVNMLKHFNQEFLKNENLHKKKLEAEHKDVLRLKSLLSDKECLYRDANKRLNETTLKLNETVSKLSFAKINVDKFNLSSKMVEKMINAQLHGKTKGGIGYHEEEPPFNSNYTSFPQDIDEIESLNPESLGVDPITKDMNCSNKSESFAEKLIVDDDRESRAD